MPVLSSSQAGSFKTWHFGYSRIVAVGGPHIVIHIWAQGFITRLTRIFVGRIITWKCVMAHEIIAQTYLRWCKVMQKGWGKCGVERYVFRQGSELGRSCCSCRYQWTPRRGI
jgi:hypothetical protein